MRKSELYAVAAWAGLLAGLLEAGVLSFVRLYPAILAPYKASADIVWISPVVNIAAYLALATALMLVARFIAKRLGLSELLFAIGCFIFTCILTLAIAPKVLHPIAAILLALGFTVTIVRKLDGHEPTIARSAKRRLLWIPAILIAAIVAGSVYEPLQEKRRASNLPPSPGQAKNVMIVVLDTVRYDHMLEGGTLTPALNRFVAKGVRFENAWSSTSWSLPSQASILTGRYPAEHTADWPLLKLNPNHPILAEFFTSKGYATGAFSGNAAWVAPDYLGRGFLRFDVFGYEDIFRRTVFGRHTGKLTELAGLHMAGRGKKAPALNRQFLKFLDDYRERPFFAYLCYMDVNQSLYHREFPGFGAPRPPEEELFKAYDAGLQKVDAQIGELLSELERRGVLSNTLVIVTSDHGESIGGEDHDARGHGSSLYIEQTKVPLFVIEPGAASSKVSSAVSTAQIPATITQLLQLQGPFPGTSLLQTPSDFGALSTLKYDHRNIRSMVAGHGHFLEDLSKPQVQKQREEFYDLSSDPFEKKSLPVTTEVRERLKQALANTEEK